MEAKHEKTSGTIRSNFILKSKDGTATLKDIASWQQSLIAVLGSKGFATQTPYVRKDNEAGVLHLDDVSEEGLKTKYPPFSEVNQQEDQNGTRHGTY